MRRIISTLILAVAVVAAPAAGVPSSGCGPNTAFENEQVRIWFQGFKGHIKVENVSAEGSSFDVKTVALTERAGDQVLGLMNLERAYPQDASECTVTQEGDEIVIAFGVTADVRAPGEGAQGGDRGAVGQARVRFVFHFNTADNGSKFDLSVEDWPWQSTESTLDFDLNLIVEDATIEPAQNGVGFRDSDGNPRGYFAWDPEFVATYSDEHEETGTVESTTTAEGGVAGVHLEFAGVTAGYRSLFYDPWMGVGPYVVVGQLLLGDRLLVSPLEVLRGAPSI
ncbi:MAG: hypothetical protein WDA27_04670 [Actinomycetota bacterium]